MNFIWTSLRQMLALAAVVLFCSGCANGFLPPLDYNPWESVSLPTTATLSDIAFTGDRNHGWLVGKESTLLETTDAGRTWTQRVLNLGDQPYTFTSVSFAGDEGWVAGQPSILLHTKDAGTTWESVPLSDKLPGSPNTVMALAPQTVEMTTDVGAIYLTKDAGQTWKALVQEAVGVIRNIARSPDGAYVAVSSRGNFYSTWTPGATAWEPHNRNSSRRLQNMGFSTDGRLWLLARGGIVQFTQTEDNSEWGESVNPEFATSWGLLDLAYRTPDEVWVAGGSGNLLVSMDGGQTWLKDRDVENIPSNFYKIVFITPTQGFILGQEGTLLHYQEAA